MKRFLALLLLFACEEFAVNLAACEGAPSPPPVTVPVASSAPSASAPPVVLASMPPDAAVCVPEVKTEDTEGQEAEDLRLQGVKSMCDALARTCGGPGDSECDDFMRVYFAQLLAGKGPFPPIRLKGIWTPTGWMDGLKPWQVFCVAKGRTAAEVRSCNTKVVCNDIGPLRKLK